MQCPKCGRVYTNLVLPSCKKCGCISCFTCYLGPSGFQRCTVDSLNLGVCNDCFKKFEELRAKQPSTSAPEEASTVFSWMIKNFSGHNKELTSTSFSLPTKFYNNWHLRLDPRSIDDGSEPFVKISLILTLGFNMELRVSLYLSILCENGTSLATFSQKRAPISKIDCQWKTKNLITREELLNKIKDHGDQFIVFCDLKLISNELLSEFVKKTCPNISKAMLKLLGNERFCDVMLRSSDGKELPAYKGILAARSPVFFTMFSTDMMEKNSKTVDIPDIDSRTLEHLIEFIYNGTLDIGVMSEDDMISLFQAAHKYQIDSLQDLLEESLTLEINVSNAIDLLVAAHLYQCKKLKNRLLKFVCSKKIMLILKTQKWKDVVSSHPDLMNVCLPLLIDPLLVTVPYDCIDG